MCLGNPTTFGCKRISRALTSANARNSAGPSMPGCASWLWPTNLQSSRNGNALSYNQRNHFFFQAEDGIRDYKVTGVQTCALPISRWLIDASGRATLLARKLGHFRPNTEHPINAVWARFTGVKDWDSYDWREKFRDYMDECRTARSLGPNPLTGPGWRCWVIPFRGVACRAGHV